MFLALLFKLFMWTISKIYICFWMWYIWFVYWTFIKLWKRNERRFLGIYANALVYLYDFYEFLEIASIKQPSGRDAARILNFDPCVKISEIKIHNCKYVMKIASFHRGIALISRFRLLFQVSCELAIYSNAVLYSRDISANTRSTFIKIWTYLENYTRVRSWWSPKFEFWSVPRDIWDQNS